jgi:hypothetical protein
VRGRRPDDEQQPAPHYSAAPSGQMPSPAGSPFISAGSQFGMHRFTLALHVDRGLGRYTYWNFGVRTGSTMHLVKFHPVR